MSIGKKRKARLEIDRVQIVRIPKATEKVEYKPARPPKVNPRVTPEEAIKALKNAPGGPEVIKQLEKEGKRLT